MIKRTQLYTLRHLKVGDRVTPVANYQNFASGGANDVDALKYDEIYVVTGVHRHGQGGGTISIDGVRNTLSPSIWVEGSFGYALFDKVETSLLAEVSTDDLIAELKSRGTLEGTFTITTTETIDL